MAEHQFRVLPDKPLEYTPIASQRAFLVRVNQRSYLIAKLKDSSFLGQSLVAITPDKLLLAEARELMQGKPFTGVDGVNYIIQS